MTHGPSFFELESFAVVSATDLRPFPHAVYRALRERGATVHAVDLSGVRYIAGDEASPSLEDLPAPVQAVLIDLPRARTLGVIRQASAAGARAIWLLDGESPEALQLADELGLLLERGDPLRALRPRSFFARLFGRR
jgi:predicted CoA-binding protein